MRIRGAIFDMDGTLLDSMGFWGTLAERTLHACGCTLCAEDALALRHRSLEQAAVYLTERYDTGLSPDGFYELMSRLTEEFYRSEARTKPGVPAFLAELDARGVVMCVATATESDKAQAALEHQGIAHYFQAFLSCADLDMPKRDPRIYREALRVLGTTRAQTPVFEDMPHTLRIVAGDGFPAVAVRDDRIAYEEVCDIADLYLDDFTDFAAFERWADSFEVGGTAEGGREKAVFQ